MSFLPNVGVPSDLLVLKQVWTHSSHPQGVARALGGKMSFAPHNTLPVPRNNSAVEPAKRARTEQSWEQAYALPGTGLWGDACASLQGTLLSGVCHSSCYSDFFFLLYSLFSKLISLMLHDTLFLVLSVFWLDVSIFQHMHPCLWGGKVVIKVEIQEGLNGRCSCPLAEELHMCNCTKTGHLPSTPGKSVHVARTSENLRPCIRVIWLPKRPFSCLGNVFLASLHADKSLERWILKDLVPEVK